MPTPLFELQLLGRHALSAGAQPLTLTVRKTWALLVLLALQGAGQTATRERLVAMLWPALDESHARRNLRRELARLAQAGAAGLVRAEGDYLALADDVALDARRFEAACAAGQADAALALWRGPVADGLQLDDAAPFEDWLAAERERLRGLWRQTLDSAAQTATPDQAAVHWQTLLADDPLQERHHRALMQWHVAAGRREAALAQYERCRVLLASELGLAPLAETDALAAQARGALAARTAAPKPVRGADWSAPLPFVGREREVQQLEAAWPDARLLWIEGEGGVGKSRLAGDFCAAHGPFALARCRPGDRAVPFAAFARVLRTLAGEAALAPALQALPAWTTPELARLLPELGSVARPLASADEQTRFFEALALAWQRLSEGSFDAIVIDDWHHADDASQALLAFVVARLGRDSARVLLLARPLPQTPPLAASAALRLLLQPLPDDAVADLVHQLAHAPAPTRFAQRLQRATGGNPFFIAETLRHLRETDALRSDAQGRWHTRFDDDTQDYHELPLPATVRDAVLARVQRLPDAARRLLEAASVAAEPFAPALLAAACALSELEALAAIEQALAAALLREHEHGGYAFGHDLAQQALESALTPERRRLVHRRLALAAQATHADPGLIAAHFEAGGEPERALPHHIAAGDEARRLFAHAQALAHWHAALRCAPAPARSAALQLRIARVCIDRGDGDGARTALAALDQLLADGGVPEDDRISSRITRGEVLIALNQSALALAGIDALLAALPEAHTQRAKALMVRCQTLHNLGRLDEAQAVARAALALLDPADALARATLLDMLQLIEYQRGHLQEALAVAREAAAVWVHQGDRRALAKAHYRIGVLLLVCGQPEPAEIELNRARAMNAAMHLVEPERDTIMNLIKVHADRGEAAQMLELADAAWSLSPDFPRARVRQILLQARFTAYCLLGDLGRALELAEQFLAEAERINEPVSLQYAALSALDLCSYLGDFERGRALLARVGRAAVGELAYFGNKLALAAAFLETRAGNLAASRAALAPVQVPGVLQQPQDRATLALREAELQLAKGDAAAVLATLAPWADAAPNVELAAMVSALRLQALQRDGGVPAAAWTNARAMLQGPGMPALEALDLRRALRDTAPDASTRAALDAEVDQAVNTMAQSLAGWPDQQQRFLAQAAD